MSRSGDSDEFDVNHNLYRQQVENSIRGKRGQAFLMDLVKGLDEMPVKRLIVNSLQCTDGMCAMGVVGSRRWLDLSKFNPTDDEDDNVYKTEMAGDALNIAPQLAAETAYINDEVGQYDETPEERFARVRAWAASNLVNKNV